MSTLKNYQEFHGRTKFFCDIKIFMYSVRCYMNGKTPPKNCAPTRGKNMVQILSPSPLLFWFYLLVALVSSIFVSFID